MRYSFSSQGQTHTGGPKSCVGLEILARARGPQYSPPRAVCQPGSLAKELADMLVLVSVENRMMGGTPSGGQARILSAP